MRPYLATLPDALKGQPIFDRVKFQFANMLSLFKGQFSTTAWLLYRKKEKMKLCPMLAVVVAVATLGVVAIMFRYQLTPTSLGMIYRLDRWTGAIVAIRGSNSEHLNLNSWEEVPKLQKSK